MRSGRRQCPDCDVTPHPAVAAKTPHAHRRHNRRMRRILTREETSFVASVLRRVEIQVVRIESGPKAVKQFARHRLLQIELHNFPVGRYAELPGIRMGYGLDVTPSPGAFVSGIGCCVIDSVLAKSEGSVAAAKPPSAMSRDFGERGKLRLRIAVDHRPAYHRCH